MLVTLLSSSAFLLDGVFMESFTSDISGNLGFGSL